MQSARKDPKANMSKVSHRLQFENRFSLRRLFQAPVDDDPKRPKHRGRVVRITPPCSDMSSLLRQNFQAAKAASKHLAAIAEGPAEGGPEKNPDNHGVLKMLAAQKVSADRQIFLIWPHGAGYLPKPTVYCYAFPCIRKKGEHFFV